jgi:hypothetical protein
MLDDKFNLFLAVGNKQHLEFCLTCSVKNILISYAYKEPWQLAPLLKHGGINVMMDSGAFTAWNLAQRKKQEGDPNWEKYLVNIDDYAKFIEKYKDVIFRAVNLDVIPGQTGQEPTEQERIDSAEQGWKNYKYLKDVYGFDTIHVFHQGEPFKYLDRMLEECDYIGVSPSNDYTTEHKKEWLDHAFRHILTSQHPNIKTHGFGVTAKALVERYPWYSVDSSSHSFTAGLGTVFTPWGRVYISDRNQSDPDHISSKPQMIQDHIEKYLKEITGCGIKEMTSNEEEFIIKCPKCNIEIEHRTKVQSYKIRNYANIIYFMNLEKRVRESKITLDFMKQGVLNI